MSDPFDDSYTKSIDYSRFARGRELFFIIGPCVLESEQLAMDVAMELAAISRALNVTILFKSSFDKANRTSVDSFRGPGLTRGLEMLANVREKTGLYVVSDIHTPDQAPIAGQVLDVIQIPAFLSRQTDLLVAAAQTGRIVNVKKGQFQSPEDMEHAIQKVLRVGNDRILLTERGTSFGYRDLVVDMRAIVRMKQLGFPVVFDATHSSQVPGGGNGCSSGDRSLVAPLARAAVAANADAIFMEVHPDPDQALCDGPNSLHLRDVNSLIANLVEIKKLIPPQQKEFIDRMPSRQEEKFHEDSIGDRLKKIRLVIFDVDGVLTDGSITFGGSDLEIKSFNVRDGHGIKIAKRCGLEIAMVTGRTSEVVSRRADDLGISLVFQGIWDKRPVLEKLVNELNLQFDEVAVIGDDVVDIPLMRRVGVSFTVPEAPEEVLRAAHRVTRHAGGRGAAREVIEMIMKAQGTWIPALGRYYQ